MKQVSLLPTHSLSFSLAFALCVCICVPVCAVDCWGGWLNVKSLITHVIRARVFETELQAEGVMESKIQNVFHIFDVLQTVIEVVD